MNCLASLALMFSAACAQHHVGVPFQLTEEYANTQLAYFAGEVSRRKRQGHEFETPAVTLGAQFFYTFDEQDLMTIEQAMDNPRALPPDQKLLASHPEQWERFQKIKDKLRYGPILTWGGGETVRHAHFTLPQQTMVGVALSRYHCVQTMGPATLHWAKDASLPETGTNRVEVSLPDVYWGEDGSLDENEELTQISPELCDYYNQRSEALFFERVRWPANRSFGGADWYTAFPTWAYLDMYAALAVAIGRPK